MDMWIFNRFDDDMGQNIKGLPNFKQLSEVGLRRPRSNLLYLLQVSKEFIKRIGLIDIF